MLAALPASGCCELLGTDATLDWAGWTRQGEEDWIMRGEPKLPIPRH